MGTLPVPVCQAGAQAVQTHKLSARCTGKRAYSHGWRIRRCLERCHHPHQEARRYAADRCVVRTPRPSALRSIQLDTASRSPRARGWPRASLSISCFPVRIALFVRFPATSALAHGALLASRHCHGRGLAGRARNDNTRKQTPRPREPAHSALFRGMPKRPCVRPAGVTNPACGSSRGG